MAEKSRAATTLRIPDYELLRLVGRGSYGEVWMARNNALGTLRAVKVVWRRNFEEERPYEREFHGIRKFEPISRKHEGLVDVFHVGRNNDDGYFYYVMELADDAALALPAGLVPPPGSGSRFGSSAGSGWIPDPGSGPGGDYRPMTLREEVRAYGRLTVGRSVEIGAKLASALNHLHQAELVHRDIKPSNIIFVGGTPKLADIGLVAGIADARSYVGTEGFVPPEGPGSPLADIFSLGKVLYEMSTGMDRNDFPKLPLVGGESGIDPEEFAEFNEVLLKACEPVAAARYQTASALFEDLVLLQAGKSLRRVRGLERRTAFLTKLGAVAGMIAIVASLAYYGSFRKMERALRAEREAVAQIELLEMQKAEELFRRDDSGTALAHLAGILRINPTNRVAAQRLLSALTWRNFPLPAMEPIHPKDRVQVATFRPDGAEILAGSVSGRLESWEAATGRPAWDFQVADSEISDLTWTGEHSQLAIATVRDAILFDVATRKPTPLGLSRDRPLDSLKFSADARWILAGNADGTTEVWDVRTGRPTGLPMKHGGRLRRAVFQPGGGLVATAGSADGAARIWDPATGQPVSPILRHGTRITEIGFSPSGRLLVTAADDDAARVWHVPDGRSLGRLGHRAPVTDFAFSPDGTKVVTASEDGTAILWDTETFQPIGNPMRHRAWVKKINFSADGLKIGIIADDNTARIWDAATGLPLSEPMRHPQAVTSAGFSPHGDRLITVNSASSSNSAGSVWIWNLAPQNARGQLFPVRGTKRFARFQREAGWLAIASERSIQQWSVTNLARAPLILDTGVPTDLLALGASGARAAIVSGNQAWVWDFTTKQSVRGPLTHSNPILSAEMSHDSAQLALATGSGEIAIWSVTAVPSGPPFVSCLPQPGQPAAVLGESAVAIRFSPNGQVLAAACRDRKARLFDAPSGRLLFELPHQHSVLDVEFSPDNRWVATASADRNARVWSVARGELVGHPMPHDNDVVMARFSPDGRRVATASRDWTARIWEAETGRPVSEPLPHNGPVQVVEFSPDGTQIATGVQDGTARIWDIASGLPVTEPYRYASSIEEVKFTSDGTRLLVVPASGDIHLVEIIQPELPVPAWLPELAESVSRQRIDKRQQATHPFTGEEFFRLKSSISTIPGTNWISRWAGWFLADPEKRQNSPSSGSTRREYVSGLIQSRTPISLREALWIEPTNALAHVYLAREIISRDQNLTVRDLKDAEWHRKNAARLAPDNEDIMDLCNSVGIRIRSLRQALSR